MDVNLLTLQYFVNYDLPEGWYLTTAPIITANWETDPGNQWIIRFGGGVGKIMKFGKLPRNGQAQYILQC